ncbi:hypothetical protein D1164_04520 [Mariniphaga sediminis]|uniref:Uncharacterized protein n=1 Tax=Mariniphaga sediminis TaxID=1628158 RepID=A0A399D728_9BACT|nr:hypothetical protein [Mariniphaga sediminis]RIH66180.1 hypothetical protein D1164_04520 [Mariniphaga sediminis]
MNKIDRIMALGNLLQYYYTDLIYINNFQKYKAGQLKTEDYLQKSDGSFKSFINEFRVARNIEKGKTDELLKMAMIYTSEGEGIYVDDFAEFLNEIGITHGKTMTSLASKVLFLNNPWNILPIDNLVKRAVNLRENKYESYKVKFNEYKRNHMLEINESLASVEKHLNIIEAPFMGKLPDIQTIRFNRFLDKILWTIGKKK